MAVMMVHTVSQDPPKVAVSADGKIVIGYVGGSLHLSREEARTLFHQLRAVLVATNQAVQP